MNLLLRHCALLIQRLFCGFDDRAARYIDVELSDQCAPIFLIGAPRTGSTLLLQLLVRQVRVAYISNAMAAAPRFMVPICCFSQRACMGFNGNVRNSEFGFVPGLWAPNEAGQVMRDWFGESADDTETPKVRAMFAAIADAAQAPLVLKNQSNTLRLARIRRTFPAARLLLLRRDLRWTAQSLLLARRRLVGDERQWWSVAPPGFANISHREPLYQVLWQADRLEQIALDACLAAPQRAAVVDYEDLCAHPGQTLLGLGQRFELATTGAPPPTLSASTARRLTTHEWDELNALYAEHFAGPQEARRDAAVDLRVL
ncbi:MAG: sulfotransferase [Anaerolineae bacterium]